MRIPIKYTNPRDYPEVTPRLQKSSPKFHTNYTEITMKSYWKYPENSMRLPL